LLGRVVAILVSNSGKRMNSESSLNFQIANS
jgi:hypothetical protein